MSFFQPPPKGFREVEYNHDGTIRRRLDPKETVKREAKLKNDLQRYAQRTREAEQERIDRAAGIRSDAPAKPEKPFDELDLVLQQLQAKPELLNGRGPLNDPLSMRGGSEEARRIRQTAELDAAQTKAAAVLKGWLNPDKRDDNDDEPGGIDWKRLEGVSEEEAADITERDDDDDDDLSFLDDVEVGEVNEL